MKIQLRSDSVESIQTELLMVNYFKEEVSDGNLQAEILKQFDLEVEGFLKESLDRKEIQGESGESILLRGKKRAIFLFCSGSKSDFDAGALKNFSAQSIRRAKKLGYLKTSLFCRGLEDFKTRTSLLVEGIYVGNYSFNLFKESENGLSNGKSSENQKEKAPIEVNIFCDSASLKEEEKKLEEGKIVGESICFARDLINRPSNHCTPSILLEEAKRFSKGTKLKMKVFEEEDAEKMKMHSFLSVAKGSDEPAKIILLHHKPSQSKKKIALVGKGITFDTGGISLKPSSNMHEMKGDMSGAAAVLGAMVAISKLNLPIEVLGIVPTTENMPSGHATKPGDIVRAMNGKSIEILNTDAEGRLILADALCYAVQEKAEQIIDVATLTGACVVALGEITTGLMTNQNHLAHEFIRLSEECGEKVWQLPLFKEYHEQIKSDIADVANIGGRYGGTITAAAFLEKFVSDVPWIHLDIAGTFWSNKDAYYSKGGTGVMVTSLVRYTEKLANS